MTTLLLEPFGGLAGDMFLAALLDLGDERFTLDRLRTFVEAVLPGECRLELSVVKRGSIRASYLSVQTSETDHPPHRHLSDLLALVEASDLGETARLRAEGVLRRIAVAEASVHGSTIEAVHFHEVGAVDTIVDVCGAAFALQCLDVDQVLATPPYVGGGTVQCAHGEMPVPAPGTTAILGDLSWTAGVGGERLTPTGAALYAELAGRLEAGTPFRARAVGYGSGLRDPKEGPPNLVRVQLATSETTNAATDSVLLLAFQLDDATGEEIGFLVNELRRAGALEAWTEPIQMKKDRPGTLVSALCRADGRQALENAAFLHSPTLGVRWTPWERTVCDREMTEIELDGHTVRIKLRRRPGVASLERVDVSPEYDDLAKAATETGQPLRALEARAIEAVLARDARGT